jgi:hypothetical protein
MEHPPATPRASTMYDRAHKYGSACARAVISPLRPLDHVASMITLKAGGRAAPVACRAASRDCAAKDTLNPNHQPLVNR